MNPRPLVVMPDAFGPSHQLVAAFARRGWPCAHVDCRPDQWIAQRATFNAADFAANLEYRGDLPALLGRLRELGASHVCTPFETGVMFGDLLAERLGLDGNGTALSRARRDKYVQTEAVRAAGLPAAAQQLFADAEDAVRWVRGSRLPAVMVKRTDSAGTDGVYRCDTAADVRRAFAAIVGTRSKFGEWNRDALVMEFLDGDEYVVDLVASEHVRPLAPDRPTARCVAVWRYRKQLVNGVPLYHAMEVLPARGPVQDRLVAYARAVTRDALGVRFGPTHTEIIWRVPAEPDGVRKCLACRRPVPPADEPRPSARFCSAACYDRAHGLTDGPPAEVRVDGGPVLVETGARLHGGGGPTAGELATPGRGQVEMTAEAVVDPAGFHRAAAAPYRLARHAWQVFLSLPRGGTFRGVRRFDEIETLPSFAGKHLKYKPGDRVEATVDHWTMPGYVLLAHPDRAVVERDYHTIRRRDATDLWDVA